MTSIDEIMAKKRAERQRLEEGSIFEEKKKRLERAQQRNAAALAQHEKEVQERKTRFEKDREEQKKRNAEYREKLGRERDVKREEAIEKWKDQKKEDTIRKSRQKKNAANGAISSAASTASATATPTPSVASTPSLAAADKATAGPPPSASATPAPTATATPTPTPAPASTPLPAAADEAAAPDGTTTTTAPADKTAAEKAVAPTNTTITTSTPAASVAPPPKPAPLKIPGEDLPRDLSGDPDSPIKRKQELQGAPEQPNEADFTSLLSPPTSPVTSPAVSSPPPQKVPPKVPPNRPPPRTSSSKLAAPINISLERSGTNLSEITREILSNKNVVKLLLSRNRISSLPSELAQIGPVQVLDLSYNKFSDMSAFTAAVSFKTLSELRLGGNRITRLPAGLAEACPALTKLDLSHNRLQSIPADVFTLSSVRYLNLSYNCLKSVEAEIGGLTGLSTLDLSHNELESLPEEIGQLESLTELQLSDNSLTALPDSIASLAALTSLDCSNNQLSELPEAIGRCISLQKLFLAHNLLTALPLSVYGGENYVEPTEEDETLPEEGLFQLQELDLSHNKFASLPEEFYRLNSLLKLNAMCNLLTELSPSIEWLYNLTELNVAFNQLQSLPEQYGYLKCLENFNASHNQLTEIPSPSFFLVKFDVSYNKLTSLPDMEGMEYLRELLVSGNPSLGDLPEVVWNLRTFNAMYPNMCLAVSYAAGTGMKTVSPILSELSDLEVLDLSHNDLTEIPDISGLRLLKCLDLSHNQAHVYLSQLSALPGEVDELYELQSVDISFNKFTALPSCFAKLAEREVEMIYHCNPLPADVLAKQFSLSGLSLAVGFSEMIGRRPTQEDALLLHGSLGGEKGTDLIGVFDGHASRVPALFCAEKFPGILAAKLKENVEPLKALYESFKEVNCQFKEVVQKAADRSTTKFSGTTALVCLFRGGDLYVANLGDTRAVLSRKGTALRVSKDHKPGDREEEDRIVAVGGHVVVHQSGVLRVNGNLAVSRAIGDFNHQPFVSDEAYLAKVSLTSEDQFVVLACDGVWDVLTDQECIDIAAAETDPFCAARRVRDAAFSRNSGDNISVIVVKLNV